MDNFFRDNKQQQLDRSNRFIFVRMVSQTKVNSIICQSQLRERLQKKITRLTKQLQFITVRVSGRYICIYM